MDKMIERLKVPKIWDKQHRVCPRKRCILAVLLYRQPYKANKRYRTISDIAKSLGWNRRTVRHHLVHLKEWGYVVEEDGQYDVVRRDSYTPLNSSGSKAWWADYAWDWLNSDQYSDCTEQYVLKVKSEYPDMGTIRLAALCGISRRTIRDILDSGGTLKKATKKPTKQVEQPSWMEEPTAQDVSAEIEERQYHAKKRIAATEKRLAEQPINIDKLAVLRGIVSPYWVAVACPERWDELCPGEDSGVYPITPGTRRWYQENYATVRQSA
jgi:biotin operon repressor